eukprot:TRINITY_DN19915_c0_g1_i1.p1 TRINITY_DN19915_c0_g1~~TRINITY_DN19915_c0_g1_i1.p1  ORF type:complete len:577 (-),score=124.90 TRINITY_DN19915_c0_g1_i1:173-1903(-)
MAPKSRPRSSSVASSSSVGGRSAATRGASISSPARRSTAAAGKAKARTRSHSTRASTTTKSLGKEGSSPAFVECAAVKLQAFLRGFIGRRKALVARREAAFEKRLAEEERRAELAVLQAARLEEAAALERRVERERARRELEENTAKMVSAAFDDEIEEVETLLGLGVPADALNRRGISALSEAACGGAAKTVDMLLRRKANPNHRGEFGRTPIWRASHQGHVEVVTLLLEFGGDPRINNDNYERASDVAATSEIAFVLESWDTTRTEDLCQEYAAWSEKQGQAAERAKAEAMQCVEAELESAKSDYCLKQKQVAHMKAELRRRIIEHDLCLAERKPTCVQDSLRHECEAAEKRIDALEAQLGVAQARLDAANVSRIYAAEDAGLEGVSEGSVAERSVRIRDLDDVLIRDIGDVIAEGTRWPLVKDPTSCAANFLQYAGHAVLNFWRADEMHPEHVRKALLSMIRAGGILAVNLLILGGGTGLIELAEPFESIWPGLFGLLLTRKILAPDPRQGSTGLPLFYGLVDKEKDADTFQIHGFPPENIPKFKFVVITSSAYPHQELVDSFNVFRVCANAM